MSEHILACSGGVFVRHLTSGRRRGAFRPIAVVSFCITSVRLRTLSGVLKLVSAEFGTGGRP